MQILEPNINQYLQALLPERDSILHEMEELAHERHFPIIGPLVGRLCYQLIKAINAKRIFEMGSGFGYSAYWMVMALAEDGKIIGTERSEENIRLARDFFQRGGLATKVEFLKGDALELIQKIEGQFDLIMNDVEKERYPAALEVIIPRLRPGGLLITDNMFWHGRVVETTPDRSTQGILKYTKSVYESKELWTTIIPLRDGVGVSLKL
ncbi:MAG: O-methyltransferase [bacterium]